MVALAKVKCNYSIASGGGRAATDEMKGDSEAASKGSAQVVKEVYEEVGGGGGGSWTEWAKDKIQGGLGLKNGEKNEGVEEGNNKIHQVIDGIFFDKIISTYF